MKKQSTTPKGVRATDALMKKLVQVPKSGLKKPAKRKKRKRKKK